jgi:hypothetical protein
MLLLMVALLLPTISIAHEAYCRMTCSNHLRQIALALQSYHTAFKCFPPAYMCDKLGKPMHSWRVLILPYLECDSLYKQYDFGEPWDGLHNRKLLTARPDVYACPADTAALTERSALTNYVAVVGSNAAWLGNKSKALNDPDLRGKDSQTIMLAEVADAGIRWTEPRDLSLSAMQDVSGKAPTVTISSKHNLHNGFFYHDTPAANVAAVDGTVRYLPVGWLPTAQLQRLLSISGINDDTLDFSPKNAPPEINWPNCAALATWCVSVGLLMYQAVRSRGRRAQLGVKTLE